MTNHRKYVLLAMLGLLTATVSLHAQSGCFESPEAPTDVLLLAGAASMFYGPTLLRKIASRMRSQG